MVCGYGGKNKFDMRNLILWIKRLIFKYKKRRKVRRKINELKKKDPFIYKH